MQTFDSVIGVLFHNKGPAKDLALNYLGKLSYLHIIVELNIIIHQRFMVADKTKRTPFLLHLINC